MALRNLEKTPSGWGSGVDGVRHIMCETKPNSIRTICKVYPEEITEEPAILSGVEVRLKNVDIVNSSRRLLAAHFNKGAVCWVDAGTIECDGYKE